MAGSTRAFAALAALALLIGCNRPTHDQALLRGIKAEADVMMGTPPPKTSVTVPEGRWPKAIASLKPFSVTIYPDGIDIMTQHDFDGGWGYFIPRSEAEPPEPAGRFSKLGQGVYWYHPY